MTRQHKDQKSPARRDSPSLEGRHSSLSTGRTSSSIVTLSFTLLRLRWINRWAAKVTIQLAGEQYPTRYVVYAEGSTQAMIEAFAYVMMKLGADFKPSKGTK